MLNIDLEEIQEIDSRKIIEAKLKSAFIRKNAEFIVEDVGFYMDCLGGKLPGPLIKWFLDPSFGNKGIYETARLHNNFGVEVRATIGYVHPRGEMYFFEGNVQGTIVNPTTDGKFGWDPVFKPLGYDKTYADMSTEEKNSISHRGIAFRKLKEFLDKNI